MKVLVTGGAGFIGYHLSRHHSDLGHEVVIVDNMSKSGGVEDTFFTKLIESHNVEYLQMDLTEPSTVRLPECDVVYHLAAINGTRLFYEIPYELARANLLMTINVLRMLEESPPGKLVYSSTSEVYADALKLGISEIPTDETVPVAFSQPTSARFSYGTSKFMGEFLCFAFGRRFEVPTTVLRYHNIYGPRMGDKHVIPEFIARAARKEDPFVIHGGDETRAFCFIEDAVKATSLIGKTDSTSGEIVHVGNPEEELQIRDLARLLLDSMEVEVSIEEDGSKEASVARRCPDISKLTRLTGFAPSVPLKDGLRRTVDWYLEYGGEA